jgi:hypothetical protein
MADDAPAGSAAFVLPTGTVTFMTDIEGSTRAWERWT